jgi:deoxyribonuclease-4
MLFIGSHVSFKSDTGLLGSVQETLSYGANSFMFYTGAPQNTQRSTIDDLKTYEGLKLMQDNNMKLENVIVHAPYIINLANNIDISKWEFTCNFLRQEINRCNQLGVKYMVLHPGSSVGLDRKYAISNIIRGLNNVLIDDDEIVILLETMALKGTEIGSIEEIKTIIDGVNNKKNIGVCLDTCHLNDAGIDISKFDEFLDEFDKLIGIDKIKCIHVNDSKNEQGSHKDRHENIGFGTIGFDNLLGVLYNKRLENIPKILETPYIDKEIPPYKFEIEMIRNKEFNKNLYSDAYKYYKGE